MARQRTIQTRDGPQVVTRHRNDGVRKVCDCPRRVWAKCPHPWYVNFKWNGTAYRRNLDKIAQKRLATKAEAEDEFDHLKIEIRAGRWPVPETEPPTPTAEALTFRTYGAMFVERWSRVTSHKATWRNDATIAAQLAAMTPEDGRAFGDTPIGAITEDALETLLRQLRDRGLAASTRNKYLQFLKSASKWGVKKGYLSRPWLSPETDLRREKHAQRNRRLSPEEETVLLKAASPRLGRLILAALETGCRLGELLYLQWGDVNLDRGEIKIRAAHTKDREDRHLPISARLRGVLEMNRLDPGGHELPPSAYVFGDAIGQRIASIRTPWETAVLKSFGNLTADEKHPLRNGPKLRTDARARLREIDLHFHDLRHEAGSRFLEAGWPLHHVKDMLGHAGISTTDTYLNVTRIGLAESMRRFDEERARCKPVANRPPAGLPLPCNELSGDTGKGLIH